MYLEILKLKICFEKHIYKVKWTNKKRQREYYLMGWNSLPEIVYLLSNCYAMWTSATIESKLEKFTWFLKLDKFKITFKKYWLLWEIRTRLSMNFIKANSSWFETTQIQLELGLNNFYLTHSLSQTKVKLTRANFNLFLSHRNCFRIKKSYCTSFGHISLPMYNICISLVQ